MSSKALVTTDWHIHTHKDVVDWVFRVAIERKCDYIFFLGDLFHERSKIDVLTYLRTFELFMKYMKLKQFKFYIMIGNHCMYHKERWDITSVKPLSAIEGVQIIDQPCRTVINDKKIDWLPYTDNPVKVLDEFKKEHGSGDLLLGNQSGCHR